MTRRYLVTGGSGFIGSALVRRLVSEGHYVRVLDDNSRGRARRLADVEDKIDFIGGDVRDRATVAAACKGVDAVCHLAFINGTEFFYTKPDLVLEVGVMGMMNVLYGCLDHGIGELVLASSSEVYQSAPVIPTDELVPLSVPDPLNPRYSYGGGKIISELLAINYGRRHFERVLIFRPHNVYGADMGWEHVLPQFIARMKELDDSTPPEQPIRFPIQGSGEETRSFVHIDDFTDGLYLMMEKGEHLNIYHIGSEDEFSIAEVAKTVGSFFGRDVEIVPGALQAGGTLRRCPDISKMRAIGYAPRRSLAEGISEAAPWYIDNLHLQPSKGEK